MTSIRGAGSTGTGDILRVRESEKSVRDMGAIGHVDHDPLLCAEFRFAENKRAVDIIISIFEGHGFR